MLYRITVNGTGINGNTSCTFKLIGTENTEEEDCEKAGDLYLKVIYNITREYYAQYVIVKILKDDVTFYSQTAANFNEGVTIEKMCVKEGTYTFKFTTDNNYGDWKTNTVSIQMFDTIIIPNVKLAYNELSSTMYCIL